MKNNVKIVLLFIAFTAILFACKKAENKVIFEGGTKPVLTSSLTGNTVPLAIADKNNLAFNLYWTNPDYKFNTGVSSQDVNYTLQLDTSGANFKSAVMQEKSISNDLMTPLTVNEINSFMAKMELLENVPHNMEMRLKASFVSGAVPLYSNVIKFTATPYLDVAVPLPTTGELFLVGSATPADWSNPVPVPSQQFSKKDATTYEITIQLIGGQEFLALPLNGNWDHKYAIKRGNNPDVGNLSKGGEFGYDYGDNFYGPLTSGLYKIVLNFKTGKYSIIPQ